MVLYKVPFLTQALNLKHSVAQRMKQFYDRALRFDMGTPSRTLHQFNSNTHLSNWTLITDTIFGGKSDCELVKTNNDSCIFQGQLYTLTNGKKVLPSFARMWFVYPALHLDLSDYEDGGIKIKYRTERPDDFQLQFEFNHFVDDIFFYAPLVPSILREHTTYYHSAVGYKMQATKFYTEIDPESGEEWLVSEIPFTSFCVNNMGEETSISAIRRAKLGTTAPIYDILTLGVGISSMNEGPFSLELKSIEVYPGNETIKEF
ncbi:hypothetical protein C9374_008661 [Naegleria lovaniensis]|uniref:NADH:ubiquinone oxidoreductase intermediate-associated protein 30 domain-containing protein n=1 Tax=Naegleria lovaniensis TaxID=51637 RepID=A0AA88GES6_NAELO|nr:uncharacterized protein C9374_008661 [Naegleria lovaniensis]KAG2378039.1 hypothetical protein C9374_008661 [Naegleria lovaniensis]